MKLAKGQEEAEGVSNRKKKKKNYTGQGIRARKIMGEFRNSSLNVALRESRGTEKKQGWLDTINNNNIEH